MVNLTYDVIALDQFTAVLAEMSGQLERISGQLERIDGQTATAHVNVDSSKSSLDFLDVFGRRFKAIAAAVTLTSPIIGAAITAGVGAALVGIAALAEKSNTDVQDSFRVLWRDVVSETKTASDQLVPQLVQAGQAMDAEVRRLGPSFKAAMAGVAPDIAIITRGLDQMADNAMPGVVAAMQNSQPIARGFASVMAQSGTAAGASLTQMGQHADEMGRDVQSGGTLAASALGVVTTLATTLGDVWARNAGQVDASVSRLARGFDGFATATVPLLTAAFGLLLSVINGAEIILGPFAPLLGFLAGGAVALWTAFKLGSGAISLVKAVAVAVGFLGNAYAGATARGAAMIASLKGVEIESSAVATKMVAAGEAAAASAVDFGVAATAMATPLGIGLAVVTAGIGLFALFAGGQKDAAASSRDLTSATEDLTAALVASNGAIDDGVLSTIKGKQEFKDAATAAAQFGISQTTLLNAITQGGPALNSLRSQLNAVIAAGTKWEEHSGPRGGYKKEVFSDEAIAAQGVLTSLNSLSAQFVQSSSDQKNLTDAANATNKALINTPAYQQQIAVTAKALGLSLADVRDGFLAVMNSGKVSATDVSGVAASFSGSALAISGAAQAIKDSFTNANLAIIDAKQGIADAGHAYEQAGRGVTDAEHALIKAQEGIAQASQGVQDAEHSVTTALRSQQDALAAVVTAEKAYTKAQQDERKAQAELSQAREQAIEDLKSLHLQLADQVTSEEQARLKLFDATLAGVGSGVTPENAQALAAQPITQANEAQIKVALDLVKAQNDLNDTLNSGAKLRKDVAAADKAGVNGSEVVRSAQDQLRSAQDQVASSAEGLKRAHQGVEDAAYAVAQANRGLQRAQEGVSDAAYAEKKAHEGVTDALYAQRRAVEQVTAAKKKLQEAELDANRSLDLSTKAGQRNLGQIRDLVGEIDKEGLPAQESYNRKVDDVAGAFGISKQAAEDYLKKVGLLDKDFHYTITAVAKVDPASYQSLFSKAFIARDINRLAAGGPVQGVGGPREDANLIWASRGEFMQPADAVEHYGVGFMEAVRNKRIPRYADGGMIALVAGLAGATYQADVNVATVMGLPHPKGLPAYVPPAAGYLNASGIRADRSANRAIVMSVFADMFGWKSSAEVGATDYLLMRESGYNNFAQNPTSTAFGIFQFLDAIWSGYGIPKTSDPRLQSIAGGRYIRARYGDPIGASAHERGYNWYDQGGYLLPGVAGLNTTGKPEMVLPPDLTTVMESMYILAKSAYGQPSAPVSTITVGGNSRSPAAQGGGGPTITQNHYHLTVHSATNSEINLRAQFKRMEIASGVL